MLEHRHLKIWTHLTPRWPGTQHNNKTYRGETNKFKNAILETLQETCPDNFQVKVPSVCQLVCQVTSQLNSKEGTQLKCQRNCQVPSQLP